MYLRPNKPLVLYLYQLRAMTVISERDNTFVDNLKFLQRLHGFLFLVAVGQTKRICCHRQRIRIVFEIAQVLLEERYRVIVANLKEASPLT